MRGTVVTIALCASLAIAGCGGGDSTSAEPDTPAGAAKSAPGQLPEPEGKPEVTVPSGAPPAQLQTRDLVEGTGPQARPGDAVTVQYVGVNYRSGEQFDASWDRGEPITFQLGIGQVIKGWDQGLVGMKVGGRRELIIPPALAYGPEALPGIPANETLVFVVDLVSAK